MNDNFFIKNIELISTLVSVLGAILALLITVLSRRNRFTSTFNIRTFIKRYPFYSYSAIEQSVKYYIKPNCQVVNPIKIEDENFSHYYASHSLFNFTDKFLFKDTSNKVLLILADPGMGKTSFLINYSIYFNKRFKNSYNIYLFPLSIPTIDTDISEINNKEKSILFLDGLDEDIKSIADVKKRFFELINISQSFHKVIITSRTQIFSVEDEIPTETGIVKVGPRAAGEKRSYSIQKVYIAPFNVSQANEYLRKRYSFFKYLKLKEKINVIRNVYPTIFQNPLFLSNYFLYNLFTEYKSLTDLYEKILSDLIIRELDIKLSKEKIVNFYKDIAYKMAKNMSNYLSKEEIRSIGNIYGIEIDNILKTGQSLLNTTTEDNYYFIHKSFRDFFIAKNIADGKSSKEIEIDKDIKIFLSVQKCSLTTVINIIA